MRTPGFTAEAALGRSAASYRARTRATSTTERTRAVRPAAYDPYCHATCEASCNQGCENLKGIARIKCLRACVDECNVLCFPLEWPDSPVYGGGGGGGGGGISRRYQVFVDGFCINC
jgi:hypothetical protein